MNRESGSAAAAFLPYTNAINMFLAIFRLSSKHAQGVVFSNRQI